MIYLHFQLNYGTCGPIFLTISNAYTVYLLYNLKFEIFVSQKLRNGLTAGDEIWRVRSVTPADEHGLCPMSIRVF